MNRKFFLINNSPKLRIRVIISEKDPPKRRIENEWWIDGNRPHYVILSDLCAYLYEEAWRTYPLVSKEGGEARGYFVSQLLNQAFRKIGKKVFINIINDTWRTTNCTPNIDLRTIYGDLEYCEEYFDKYYLCPTMDEEKEKESCWHGRCWMNPKDKIVKRRNRIFIAVRTVKKEDGKVKSAKDIVETFAHELAHAADRVKERQSNMGVIPMTRFYRWLLLTTFERINFSFAA